MPIEQEKPLGTTFLGFSWAQPSVRPAETDENRGLAIPEREAVYRTAGHPPGTAEGRTGNVAAASRAKRVSGITANKRSGSGCTRFPANR